MKKRKGRAQPPRNADARIHPEVSGWQLALVLLAALACFFQTLEYKFVHDDKIQIVQNDRVHSLRNIGRVFAEPFWRFYSIGPENYYRPLQSVAYITAWVAGGGSPLPFHALNLLAHAAASIGVYGVGLLLFRVSAPAFLGAVLFAVHPMHTENVAWIAGITDVACAFFYLAALAAYLRCRDRECHMPQSLTAPLCFLAALLFKEMALTLPVIIIGLELACIPRGPKPDLRAIALRILPFAVATGIYLLMREFAGARFSSQQVEFAIPAGDRLMTMLWLPGRYLQDMIAPVRHNVYHLFCSFFRMPGGAAILPLTLLAAWIVLAASFFRRDRTTAFLAAAFLVALLPILFIGGAGPNVYSERYLYLPSFAFCLVLASLACRLLRRRWVLVCCGVVVILACTILTWRRNPVWADNRKFFTAAAAESPDSSQMRYNLGLIHYYEGRNEDARREFNAALEAHAGNCYPLTGDRAAGLMGLAFVDVAEGRADDALRRLEEARALLPEASDVYVLLGILRAKQERYAEADENFRRALNLNPNNALGRLNLGGMLALQGRKEEAEREIRAALRLDPESVNARVSLAYILSADGRREEALRLLSEASEIEPSNPNVRGLLRQLGSGARR